jgi:hypothetical protein
LKSTAGLELTSGETLRSSLRRKPIPPYQFLCADAIDHYAKNNLDSGLRPALESYALSIFVLPGEIAPVIDDLKLSQEKLNHCDYPLPGGIVGLEQTPAIQRSVDLVTTAAAFGTSL